MKTKSRLLALSATLVLMAGVVPAWADITIDGGYLQSNAVVDVNPDTTTSPGTTEVDSPFVLFTTATTYVVPALVEATDTSGLPSASGSADVNSDAILNNLGFSLSFSGTTTVESSGASGTGYAAGDLGLGLYFTPLQSATYQLSYSLSTPKLGCCGSYYSLEDASLGTNVFYYPTYGDDTNGVLTGSLIGGHEYFLLMNQSQYPYSEAATVSGVGSQSVSFDDEYRFMVETPSVSPAPEPSAWALLIAGVGVAGLALRLGRRRSWAVA